METKSTPNNEASRDLPGSINNKFSYTIDQGDLLSHDYEKASYAINSGLFDDKKFKFDNAELDVGIETYPKLKQKIYNTVSAGAVSTIAEKVSIPDDCWGYEIGVSGNVPLLISDTQFCTPPSVLTTVGNNILSGSGNTIFGSSAPKRFVRQPGITEFYISSSSAIFATINFFRGTEPSQTEIISWL